MERRNRSHGVLPLTALHQQILQVHVEQLRQIGHDVAVLEELAEQLPQLRAGLPQPERQRLDAIDRNQHETMTAWNALSGTITQLQVDVLGDGPSSHMLNAETLRDMADGAHVLAECASELSLRLRARLKLLAGEAI